MSGARHPFLAPLVPVNTPESGRVIRLLALAILDVLFIRDHSQVIGVYT